MNHQDEIHHSQEYGIDNLLNPFGDYAELRCECLRDSRMPETVTRTWKLIGRIDRVLNDAEVHQALENLFLKASRHIVKQDSSLP